MKRNFITLFLLCWLSCLSIKAEVNSFNPEDVVEVTFTIGDDSGSHSERWKMSVSGGPVTLQPQSPDYGEVGTLSINQFRKGKAYSLRVDHVGTDPEYLRYSQRPDYDYIAWLSASNAGYYVKDPPNPDPEALPLLSLSTIYGDDTNLAAGKVVAFGFPKPILEFLDPDGNVLT